MTVIWIANLYAFLIAVGFGVLVAAGYAVFMSRRAGLETQARQMGLAPGSGSPALRGYHGLYRSYYVGLEPDSESRGLRVSIAHPDQDRILKKPGFSHKSVADLQVHENVLTFRIACHSPGRPGIALREVIDTAMDML